MTKRVAGPGSDDYGVEIDFQYLAGKTIRTVELFLQPLNSVSDLAGEICKVTLNGPIEQGLTTTVYTELWNRKEHNVAKAVFKGFILHFADGTAEFYKESDISSKRTLTAYSSAPTTPPRNTSGVAAAVTLPPAFTGPMTVRKYGRSAVSVTVRSAPLGTADCLSASITPSALR